MIFIYANTQNDVVLILMSYGSKYLKQVRISASINRNKY